MDAVKGAGQSSPVYLSIYLLTATGNPKRHLDCRVYCTEPKGENRELHLRVLVLVSYSSLARLFFSVPTRVGLITQSVMSALLSHLL